MKNDVMEHLKDTFGIDDVIEGFESAEPIDEDTELKLDEKVNRDTTSRRPIRAILDDLKKPIPLRLLKVRSQGGEQIVYIEWTTALRILDHYTNGHFDTEIISTTVLGDRVSVVTRVTIHALEGSYHRDASGTEFFGQKHSGYGEPVTNAEAQSLKRSCSKFGIGLHLYDKSDKTRNDFLKRAGR